MQDLIGNGQAAGDLVASKAAGGAVPQLVAATAERMKAWMQDVYGAYGLAVAGKHLDVHITGAQRVGGRVGR
jgi:hypothetical protein